MTWKLLHRSRLQNLVRFEYKSNLSTEPNPHQSCLLGDCGLFDRCLVELVVWLKLDNLECRVVLTSHDQFFLAMSESSEEVVTQNEECLTMDIKKEEKQIDHEVSDGVESG